MNKRDLLDLLENYDDDTEVRFASQPHWPFEYSIADVVSVDLNARDCDNEYADKPDAEPEPPNEVIYLVEGNQLGYLPGVARRVIGWK